MLVPPATNQQNQIVLPAMSEFQTHQQASPAASSATAADGQSGPMIIAGIVLAAALMLLVLLSSRTSEPFLLILLAILAMVGVFFLFGLAAGHIRVGERADEQQLALTASDALGDAIYITDGDGTTIYSNLAHRDLVGLTASGEPATLQDLFVGEADAMGALFRLSRAAERGEAREEEFAVRRSALRGVAALNGGSQSAKGGAACWYRLAVRPQQQLDGAGYAQKLTVWQLTDVTDVRLRAGEDSAGLRRQLASYNRLPIGLMSVRANGQIETMNPALSCWLGLDGALPGRRLNLSDIAGQGHDRNVLQFLRQAGGARSDDEAGCEAELITAAGAVIAVQLMRQIDPPGSEKTGASQAGASQPGGQPQGRLRDGPWRVVVLKRDDDDDDVALAGEAESSDVRLAQLLQTAPFGIATVDETGRIIAKNKLFARMFRTNRAGRKETLAKLLPRTCDAEARKNLIQSVQKAAKERADMAPVEITLGAKGEHSRRIFIMPFRGNGSTGETAILYVMDTTEQKALELKFAQSQKMEAVGQLAGGIAHDFNNVLTVILGFSDLFIRTRRPTDPGYNDIMQIRSNARRAEGMVRQLLAFSRKQQLEPEVLSLNDVVQDLGYSLSRLLGERIKIKRQCQRNLWLVKADQTQLEQVVINLAVNARDAMPDGGQLTIRSKNITEPESRKLADHGMAPGEYVLLEVRDQGIGMSEDVVAKIFEPFYSTKDVGKGTGLGLSTVYGIVTQTGGYIFVDSKPGKGTVFKVYLPRHCGEAVEKDADAAGGQAPPRDLTGSGRVLLVEDEDGVRSFATRALQRQGYEVLEAASGVEALDVMAENEGRVDIVISDVVMPEMDGPALLRKLRQTDADLKFIFMSGYPDGAFSKGLEDSQSFAFLAKPFTLPQLAAKVKEELER